MVNGTGFSTSALEVADQELEMERTSDSQLGTEDEIEQVIKCMKAFNRGGRSLLCKTLHGSKSVNETFAKNSYYGIFHNYTQKEILSLIDNIVEKGFMVIEKKGNYPLLSITKKGEEYISE